jgi:NAD(P)-dependent dehydrogenase (short-subunit alcohol dehydrogenase family)
VLITGGASGLGLAFAEAFAANGAHLTLLDINSEGLARVSENLKTANPSIGVGTACGSTTDEAAVEAAFAQAVSRFGRIDVLLNNAGIGMVKPTLELSAAEWRNIVDINLTGVFLCAKAAGKYMTRQGSGVILNMASMFGVSAAPQRAGYCSTKAAVVALTKVLAVEWAQFGFTGTALVNELARAGKIDLERLKNGTPMGRLGEPSEIAELALFLASDNAAFITGQAFVADGGWTANGYLR